jgi:hypothetical protein
MIAKQNHVLPDGREFTGYKLGRVELCDHTGAQRRLQAYFVTADEDEDHHVLVVDEVDGDQDDRHDEYSFLGFYGIALGYPLIWKAQGEDPVPEIIDWFPAYETWGI